MLKEIKSEIPSAIPFHVNFSTKFVDSAYTSRGIIILFIEGGKTHGRASRFT